jgi:hypothetical protein
MPDTLPTLVSNEFEMFRQLQQEHPQLFPKPDIAPHLYPVPFFGDIRRARILTVALNPSWTEFRPARQWLANLDAQALTTRLLHYFDLPFPECHTWFAPWENALLHLGCSYKQDAAHIDLSPYPTLRPREIHGTNDPRRSGIANLILENLDHFQRVLQFCQLVRLVVVIDYRFAFGADNLLSVFQTIHDRVGIVARHIVDVGHSPPVVRGNGPDDLADWLFENRHLLRRRLEDGEILRFD